MEFLIRAQIAASQLDGEDESALLAEERARGQELRREGIIRHMWRVPGQLAHYAVYEVDSPQQLHSALTSLPLWRWMEVEVVALAPHPLFTEES